MPKSKAKASTAGQDSEYSVIESGKYRVVIQLAPCRNQRPWHQNIALMAKIEAALLTVMEHPAFSDIALNGAVNPS